MSDEYADFDDIFNDLAIDDQAQSLDDESERATIMGELFASPPFPVSPVFAAKHLDRIKESCPRYLEQYDGIIAQAQTGVTLSQSWHQRPRFVIQAYKSNSIPGASAHVSAVVNAAMSPSTSESGVPATAQASTVQSRDIARQKLEHLPSWKSQDPLKITSSPNSVAAFRQSITNRLNNRYQSAMMPSSTASLQSGVNTSISVLGSSRQIRKNPADDDSKGDDSSDSEPRPILQGQASHHKNLAQRQQAALDRSAPSATKTGFVSSAAIYREHPPAHKPSSSSSCAISVSASGCFDTTRPREDTAGAASVTEASIAATERAAESKNAAKRSTGMTDAVKARPCKPSAAAAAVGDWQEPAPWLPGRGVRLFRVQMSSGCQLYSYDVHEHDDARELGSLMLEQYAEVVRETGQAERAQWLADIVLLHEKKMAERVRAKQPYTK